MIEVPLPLGSPLPDGTVCWQRCCAVFSFSVQKGTGSKLGKRRKYVNESVIRWAANFQELKELKLGFMLLIPSNLGWTG